MASTVENVVTFVRAVVLRREFDKGRAFILSIEPSVANSLEVSLVCANFYLVFGYPKWAEESLNRCGFQDLVSKDGALFDERIACMALLWAQSRKSQYYDYEKSFALVREVEDIYVHFKPTHFDDAANSPHAVELDRIRRQTYLWTIECPEEYDDVETPLSDIRVLIEIWMLEIFIAQNAGGFMLWADVVSRFRARLPPLIKFLRSRGRKAMEGNCMFVTDVHQFLPDPRQAAAFLLEYLDSVNSDDYFVYKAAALSRLAQYQVHSNPEAATLHLDESQRLFASQGCLTHLADIDFVRIRDFQGSSHSLANRIDQLCSLIRRYRSLKDLNMQLIAVRLTLRLATTGFWKRIEPLVKEVEEDLGSAGEMFKLLVTRVVKLRDQSLHLHSSDATRRNLEEYLYTHPKELSPDLYATTCYALSQCYSTLGDFDLAVKFAEMETKSEVAIAQQHRMSDAIDHLADVSKYQIERKISRLDANATQDRQSLIESLLSIAHELEGWADWDTKHGRSDQRRTKSRTLLLIYHDLNNKYCPGKGYSEKYSFWSKENEPKDVLNPSKISLYSMATALMQFVAQKKYKEGVEFTEKALKDMSEDSSRTELDMALARFIVVISMRSAYAVVKKESEDTAKLWITKQLKWLLEDTSVLKLQLSSELLISRVSVLCWATRDFIGFYPEKREVSLGAMIEYFNDVDKTCRDWRQSLKGDEGINQLLRKRTLVSKFSVRNFYEHACEFFFQIGNETNAWYWLQKKRGQALLDMIAERATAYDQLDSAFQKDDGIKGLLLKDEALAKKVSYIDADQYMSAVDDLTEHREEMKSVPALTGLLGDSTYPSPEAWSNLDDIWSLAEWLPPDTNIVLVDWFVSPSNVVYWISKDLKRKHLTPAWMKLTIGPIFIDNWIAKYLKFPKYRDKPLQRRLRAAWELEHLLYGLDKICKPGDLVILTPPARFAAIPIHAIPMRKMPWIARNPIIYSSSFSLHRECLKRCRRISSPVRNAIFTAVYEEQGYKGERQVIMDQVKSCADMFGSRTILGSQLTSDSLRDALTSAPWIHYHGHAYYERTEALKQCFVLSPEVPPAYERLWSPGEPSEVTGGGGANPITATLEATSLEPSSTPPPSQDALLLAHLLKDSSQLAVADIFALNLSKNHPFVCTIACDSGLQDIAAGDEPLGLVTALFCAGASSVLGTLWPILSITGRSFATHFYKSICKQIELEEAKDSKIKVLNLALAVMEASLAVKKEKGDPYSWAAFVLHGAGFYVYET